MWLWLRIKFGYNPKNQTKWNLDLGKRSLAPLPLKLDPKLSLCKNVGLVLLPPSLFWTKSENMNFFFWCLPLPIWVIGKLGSWLLTNLANHTLLSITPRCAGLVQYRTKPAWSVSCDLSYLLTFSPLILLISWYHLCRSTWSSYHSYR